MNNKRVIRIPLPVDLIREMDELIETGAGGMESRAELAREAIEAMVLELRHDVSDTVGVAEGGDHSVPQSSPEVQSGPEAQGAKSDSVSQPEVSEALSVDDVAPIISTDETALPVPPAVSHYCNHQKDSESLMLGMHNRDYPSLWAASRICEMTQEAPIPFDEIGQQLIPEAWSLGERLAKLDEARKQQGKSKGAKLSALFPTNREKRKQAEENFAYFAVGWKARNSEEQMEWKGPLFDWKVVGVEESSDGETIGMTEEGRQLLEDLAGLTVVQPHPPELARRLFAHLAQYAKADWTGFITLMDSASQRQSRDEIFEVFSSQWPELTASGVRTNTAGYVARCREWGLLEMDLVDRRYALTEFGESILASEQSKEQ